jgi:hypothetical protein
MDGSRFDAIARSLARAGSRRRFLSTALVSVVAFIAEKPHISAQYDDCGFNRTKCGYKCSDLSNDSSNCGACGVRCRSYSETCRDGQCQCGGYDETRCGNSCVSLSRDSNNCGGCGIRCVSYSEICDNGQCRCSAINETNCGSLCVDLSRDSENCGSCGIRCKTDTESCQQGLCVSTVIPTREPLPSSESTNQSGSSAPTANESLDCFAVELYPGYPGYRGYVTGIDGPSEITCLDQLTATDPRFDKAHEDEANVAAARAIGLNGSPAEWTWENWMAIEAERGLPSTCYSCLFSRTDSESKHQTAPIDIFDQRLWLGGYGTTEALLQAAAGAGMGTSSSAFYIERFGGDHVLRAFIGSTWPGHHSAPEMLEAFSILFANYAQAGTLFIDPHQMWNVMLDQGGYAPTPSTAHIKDQMYMVRMGIEAMCAPGAISVCEPFIQQYEQGVEAVFRSELVTTNPNIVYVEWLREHYPDFI